VDSREFILQQKPSYSRRFFSRVETREGVWVYWVVKDARRNHESGI